MDEYAAVWHNTYVMKQFLPPKLGTVIRGAEALTVFVALPLIARSKVRIPPVAALAVLGAYVTTILATDKDFSPQDHTNTRAVAAHAPYVLLKTLGTGLFAALLTRVIAPESFLLPLRHTHRKALVQELALYWSLSVVPQELLYRTFFYHRYKSTLSPLLFGVLNASAFGFAHVIFRNKVAPLLTLGAGFLFAHSYEKHRSLPLVSLEHALYGGLLFALGLGKYFTFEPTAVPQVA